MRAPKPVEVNEDFDLLFGAIENLVDNALKFTREGGAVALGVQIEDGQPLLVVADNGPGIAPAERGAVLRTFYRGHASERSIPGHGLGLGLGLDAAIARLHDAAIEILDNEPGCRMQLLFPSYARVRLTMSRNSPVSRAGSRTAPPR